MDKMNGQEDEKTYKEFKSAAVVCNNSVSCTVGKSILVEGGSVVDAAIASMLALGVISFQSAGIGGGFIMVYYDAETGEDHVIDARTVAPKASQPDMFTCDEYFKNYGRLSISVPGEIRGYWEAHQKFGKLPWFRIFEPAIKVAESGFKMTSSCENWFNIMVSKVNDNIQLRNLLTKPDGNFMRAGDIIKRPNYGKTLRTIANEGPDAFYNGSLTESILKDIDDGFGLPSIITKQDLLEYKVLERKSLKTKLDDMHIITTPVPSGGPAIIHLLNILKGYKLSSIDLRNDKLLTHHRIVEALKFAFSLRNDLGDPDFNVDVDKIVDDMISEKYSEDIRQKIDDLKTHSTGYYGKDFPPVPEDQGTAHLGVIGENGSAVALTSTVNRPFGSNILGKRTGIIFNDQMSFFTPPDQVDYRPNNIIEPDKRCLTAISPTIVVQKTQMGSEVKMVIGGSGGAHIISATVSTMIQYFWFKKSIDEAVKEKRLHHSWHPNILRIQEGFDEEIIRGLKCKGHEIETEEGYISSVQVLARMNDKRIAAKCDDRRGGSPDGY